jgi:hypothetical protein
MRETLGVPTPEVYAWCNDSRETRVGVEYILMEKVEGVPLDTVFPSMSIEDRWALTRTIGEYQSSWASTVFEKFGSIYYVDDCPEGGTPLRFTDRDGVSREDARFSVGPTTGRDWSDHERLSIAFDRGPCQSALECSRTTILRLTCRFHHKGIKSNSTSEPSARESSRVSDNSRNYPNPP